MSVTATVRRARFRPASSADVAAGLLGWVSFEFADQLRVDGVAIRRTRPKGRLALSFPAPLDRRGCRRRAIRPLNDRARKELERQIFDLLDISEETP